jgi:hypothetical protein
MSEESRDIEAVTGPEALLEAAASRIVATAKARAKAIQDLRKACMQVTQPRHWIDEGGNPFLDSHGTDLVALNFGVSFRRTSQERLTCKDEYGEYYLWTMTVEATLPEALGSQSMQAVGSASSRDAFLGTGKNKRTIATVREADIIAKAYTAACRSAIHHLFDLRGLTWETVEALTGFRRTECSKVTYKSKSKSAGEQEPPPVNDAPPGEPT